MIPDLLTLIQEAFFVAEQKGTCRWAKQKVENIDREKNRLKIILFGTVQEEYQIAEDIGDILWDYGVSSMLLPDNNSKRYLLSHNATLEIITTPFKSSEVIFLTCQSDELYSTEA